MEGHTRIHRKECRVCSIFDFAFWQIEVNLYRCLLDMSASNHNFELEMGQRTKAQVTSLIVTFYTLCLLTLEFTFKASSIPIPTHWTGEGIKSSAIENHHSPVSSVSHDFAPSCVDIVDSPLRNMDPRSAREILDLIVVGRDFRLKPTCRKVPRLHILKLSSCVDYDYV